jgi:hypothetical protein
MTSFVDMANRLSCSAKIVDILDMNSPRLKGLQEVHTYTCDRLKTLMSDRKSADGHGSAAAYLYGQFDLSMGGDE